MKFGPKSLRFTLPAVSILHNYLWFIGRDNTIHLQETAAVVEGDLLRFRLPILDQFIKRAFSERSMITIPYSRIVRHVHYRYLAAKTCWWLLAGALLAWCYFAYDDPYTPGLALVVSAVIGLILLLLGVLVHLVFRPRYILAFRRANGERCLVCFWFTSRKQQRQFTELLQANCEAARVLAAPPAAPAGAPQPVR